MNFQTENSELGELQCPLMSQFQQTQVKLLRREKQNEREKSRVKEFYREGEREREHLSSPLSTFLLYSLDENKRSV